MELHQILRMINVDTPIVLVDLQGISICKVRSKNEIHYDLYEQTVWEISVCANYFEFYGILTCIKITLKR